MMGSYHQCSDQTMSNVEDVTSTLFQSFLEEFSLSDEDLNRREAFLLALPTDLGKTEKEQVKNIVLYPFGSFRHRIGFKEDPLLAYVSVGEPLFPVDQTDSQVSIEEGEVEKPVRKPGMSLNPLVGGKMVLLFDIKDALSSKKTCGEGEALYKDISLTQGGKLSLAYRGTSGGNYPGLEVQCVLEAKSFLPVQTSRLIKFYGILEKVFWPFAQSLLLWAKGNGVIESSHDKDRDGLKAEHFLQLIIFFLVRKRVIPSFFLLQKWSQTPFKVDGIDVGFCEDVQSVREKCLKRGIGFQLSEYEKSSSDSQRMMEGILQLQCDFLYEMGTLDFEEYGLAPSRGTVFSKHLEHQVYSSGKRQFDVNSVLCVQDISDLYQNITRKVGGEWVGRLQRKCKEGAEKLFADLWNGDMLSPTLFITDIGSSKCNGFPEGTATTEQPSLLFDKNSVRFEDLDRSHWFPVKPEYVRSLQQALEAFVEKEEGEKLVKRLFLKILHEFNGLFWGKLACLSTLYKDGPDPCIFPVLESLVPALDAEVSLENKIQALFMTLTWIFNDEPRDESCFSDCPVAFVVREDWTKGPRNEILRSDMPDGEKKFWMKKFANGFIKFPKPIFGQRLGPPKGPKHLAAVGLDAHYENNGLYLYTHVRVAEGLAEEERAKIFRFTKCYSVFAKAFVKAKIKDWIGSEFLDELSKMKPQKRKSPTLSFDVVGGENTVRLAGRLGPKKMRAFDNSGGVVTMEKHRFEDDDDDDYETVKNEEESEFTNRMGGRGRGRRTNNIWVSPSALRGNKGRGAKGRGKFPPRRGKSNFHGYF